MYLGWSINVDSPNLGFPYLSSIHIFLGGYQWKKSPCIMMCRGDFLPLEILFIAINCELSPKTKIYYGSLWFSNSNPINKSRSARFCRTKSKGIWSVLKVPIEHLNTLKWLFNFDNMLYSMKNCKTFSGQRKLCQRWLTGASALERKAGNYGCLQLTLTKLSRPELKNATGLIS